MKAKYIYRYLPAFINVTAWVLGLCHVLPFTFVIPLQWGLIVGDACITLWAWEMLKEQRNESGGALR